MFNFMYFYTTSLAREIAKVKMSSKKILPAFFIVAYAASSLVSTQVFAQESKKIYISDILFVPLRSGKGNEYRIVHKGLKSGTPLVVLEETEDNSWTKVRLENGTEGWVRNQYVMDTESARTQLVLTIAKNAELQQKLAQQSAKNKELNSTQTSLTSQLRTSSQDKSSLQDKYNKLQQLSANTVELDTRYRALLEKHEMMQAENEILSVENDTLKSDNRKDYMFYGAALLVLGMILSSILPLLKPKGRHSEWA